MGRAVQHITLLVIASALGCNWSNPPTPPPPSDSAPDADAITELAPQAAASEEEFDLIEVSGTDNAQRIADIVFVHGLDGDVRTTWQNEAKGFWPVALGKDLAAQSKHVGIWSLKYDAHGIAWQGGTLPLADRAGSVLDLLNNRGLGDRPIIFVTHSLGGLVVKQMLRHADTLRKAEWEGFKTNTLGVVFLATPHQGGGSTQTGWIRYLGNKLGIRESKAVSELEPHDSRLRELHVWYRQSVESIGCQTQSYFETQNTSVFGRIVNETTGDAGIGVPIAASNTDHITICKPRSRKSQVYGGVLKFISTTTDKISGPAVLLVPDPELIAQLDQVPKIVRVIIGSQEHKLENFRGNSIWIGSGQPAELVPDFIRKDLLSESNAATQKKWLTPNAIISQTDLAIGMKISLLMLNREPKPNEGEKLFLQRETYLQFEFELKKKPTERYPIVVKIHAP